MPGKIAVAICFLCAIALPFCASGTDKLDAATLNGSEIPKGCKVIAGKYAVDLQTQILDEHYELHQSMLPPLAGKRAQSFQCGKHKGTIFYYEYSSPADGVTAEGGLRRMLWGEDHSTPEHPEQIEAIENVVLVLSFEKVPNALLAAIRGKLRRVMNPG
jgi:hypothetical protein